MIEATTGALLLLLSRAGRSRQTAHCMVTDTLTPRAVMEGETRGVDERGKEGEKREDGWKG